MLIVFAPKGERAFGQALGERACANILVLRAEH